jgi:hypothetical protein
VQRHGFSTTCSIVAGSGDNPCAFAGMGLSTPGELGISLGTSVFNSFFFFVFLIGCCFLIGWFCCSSSSTIVIRVSLFLVFVFFFN